MRFWYSFCRTLTDPLVLDDAGGSSEFGSDESNEANASDEVAALNEEADVPIEVLRARYAMNENMSTAQATTVSSQQRPESTDGSLISAPSPTTVQKEGRSTEKSPTFQIFNFFPFFCLFLIFSV